MSLLRLATLFFFSLLPAPVSLISPVELEEREGRKEGRKTRESFSKAAKRVLILWSVRNRQWRDRARRKAEDGGAGGLAVCLASFRDHLVTEEGRWNGRSEGKK